MPHLLFCTEHNIIQFGGSSAANASLVMALLIGREEIKQGSFQLTPAVLSHVMSTVDVALSGRHELSAGTVSLYFLGLEEMSVSDSNKKSLVDAGVLPRLKQALQRNREKLKSVQIEVHCTNTLENLALSSETCGAIQSDGELCEVLRSLQHEALGNEARKAAQGAMFALEGGAKALTAMPHATAAGGHVMLRPHPLKPEVPKSLTSRPLTRHDDLLCSYNWEHQEVVVRIARALQATGISTWLDVDQMRVNSLCDTLDRSNPPSLCVT